MKKVKIHSNALGSFDIIVDESDYDFVASKTWILVRGSYRPNRKMYTYYVYCSTQRKGILIKKYLHRILTGAKPNQKVDHKNRNGLDNRRSNLRLCTNQQNIANRTKALSNTSGFKGVSVKKLKTGGLKYEAMIGVNNKKIYLGRFDSLIEAALAYNKAAVKYFGEFALLNEI